MPASDGSFRAECQPEPSARLSPASGEESRGKMGDLASIAPTWEITNFIATHLQVHLVKFPVKFGSTAGNASPSFREDFRGLQARTRPQMGDRAFIPPTWEMFDLLRLVCNYICAIDRSPA